MRFVPLTLVLTAGLLTSGCLSSVLPDPTPASSTYRFDAIGPSVTPRAGALVLRVDRPTVPVSLMGRAIIVSPDGNRLIKAGQAQWSEPIPALIQTSFFDVLSTREDLVGILPTSGARTKLRVHLTVRNFEAQFDNGESSAPLVVVKYTATVSDAETRNLIGTHDVRKTIRANTASISAIVNSQDNANKAALNDIADWLETLAGVQS